MKRLLALAATLCAGSALLAAGGALAQARAAEALAYHGGPVLTHPSTTYLVYWQGSSGTLPANYLATLGRFISDWSGSVEHGVLTQYFQAVNGAEHVAGTLGYGGTVLASDALPGAAVSQLQIERELLRIVRARGLPEGYRASYAVVLPEGVKAEDARDNCAWHDWVADRKRQAKVFYAVIPYYSASASCPMPAPPYPNGRDVDNAVDLLSHELAEIETNPWHSHAPPPISASWYTRRGQEVGDLCRSVYGPRDATGADAVLGGHPYLIQEEWSNALGGCTLGYVRIPSSYRDCHRAPGGTADIFVDHMTCSQVISVLSPPLGPGAPRPPSMASLGFSCAYLGKTADYFYGSRWDLVKCKRMHGRGGFEYIHG